MAELLVRENCTGCGGCLSSCPAGALSLETEQANGWGKKKALINQQTCTKCGACIPACPRQSLFFRS